MRGHTYRRAGFTLFEIMIVIAMLGIIAGFSSVVSFDQYRSDSIRAERTKLVAALEHARAEAMNGLCTGNDCTQAMAHGVEVEDAQYLIFQGSSFDSRDGNQDEPIEAAADIEHNGTQEIVFQPFSGNVNAVGSIVLADPVGNTATITIGQQGQISWSN